MSDEIPGVAIPESWMPKEEPVVLPDITPAATADPIVGQRAVYVADDGRHLSASILMLFADGVQLQVRDPLNAQGGFRASPVGHDANSSSGTWHYPEE